MVLHCCRPRFSMPKTAAIFEPCFFGGQPFRCFGVGVEMQFCSQGAGVLASFFGACGAALDCLFQCSELPSSVLNCPAQCRIAHLFAELPISARNCPAQNRIAHLSVKLPIAVSISLRKCPSQCEVVPLSAELPVSLPISLRNCQSHCETAHLSAELPTIVPISLRNCPSQCEIAHLSPENCHLIANLPISMQNWSPRCRIAQLSAELAISAQRCPFCFLTPAAPKFSRRACAPSWAQCELGPGRKIKIMAWAIFALGLELQFVKIYKSMSGCAVSPSIVACLPSSCPLRRSVYLGAAVDPQCLCRFIVFVFGVLPRWGAHKRTDRCPSFVSLLVASAAGASNALGLRYFCCQVAAPRVPAKRGLYVFRS